MSSRPKTPTTRPMRRTRRRTTTTSQRRFCRAPKSPRAVVNGGDRSCSSVSDKLEALKNLIPDHDGNGEIKTDELFQETADYIVLLRTQVLILQRLVDFYGSTQNQNAIDS